jgi:hypothetical protein
MRRCERRDRDRVWHHVPFSSSGVARTSIVFDKTTPDEDFFLVELPKTYRLKVKVDISTIKA